MEKIQITFPDGNSKEFDKGITALDIAKSISHRLADEALAVKLDGVIKELYTPINSPVSIQFLTFEQEEGRHVYWHSSSHLMAHAIQALYPEARFGVGPAIDSGFYYDFDINTKLTEDDLLKIEKKMLEIAASDNTFQRSEMPKAEALKFFADVNDPYKQEIISELNEEGTVISTYKEGEFTDLCTGPHLPSTGKIKCVKLLTVSGSYWRGDEKRKQLQRIYGITFPKKKLLDDYLAFLEEAKKRDHRKLGKQLDLFSIHEEAGAGLIYWHPKGSRIR
ncbi:MAG: TGS domain-containing protein, partial [Ignavibacteriales bacterium]|nr:TGS domain-containing protein [Ignavibacteriales bacterium]